jgi:hypothetical protein
MLRNKYKLYFIILYIIFASFTISNAQDNLLSKSDDPIVIKDEIYTFIMSVTSRKTIELCSSKMKPDLMDITKDSRYITEAEKAAEKASQYVITMRKQGMSFAEIEKTQEFNDIIGKGVYNMGVVFGKIWKEIDAY